MDTPAYNGTGHQLENVTFQMFKEAEDFIRANERLATITEIKAGVEKNLIPYLEADDGNNIHKVSWNAAISAVLDLLTNIGKEKEGIEYLVPPHTAREEEWNAIDTVLTLLKE